MRIVLASAKIYSYALNLITNGYNRIASFGNDDLSIMSVWFDRDTNLLWAGCDDTCAGRTTVYRIDETNGSAHFGEFRVVSQYDRPSTMPNINNEGYTMAPESSCVAGMKNVYWADDADTDNHVIRMDNVPCGMN